MSERTNPETSPVEAKPEYERVPLRLRDWLWAVFFVALAIAFIVFFFMNSPNLAWWQILMCVVIVGGAGKELHKLFSRKRIKQPMTAKP